MRIMTVKTINLHDEDTFTSFVNMCMWNGWVVEKMESVALSHYQSMRSIEQVPVIVVITCVHYVI